jgi:hypothetical protein
MRRFLAAVIAVSGDALAILSRHVHEVERDVAERWRCALFAAGGSEGNGRVVNCTTTDATIAFTLAGPPQRSAYIRIDVVG